MRNEIKIMAVFVFVVLLLFLPSIYSGITGLFFKERGEEWENRMILEASPGQDFIVQKIVFDKYKPLKCEDAISVSTPEENNINFEIINSTYRGGFCVEATIKFKNVAYEETTSTIPESSSSIP
ncbi:MAG: hypothetical protein J7L08_03130, partial [Candidatus Aenigmarchaeota archaeon]|nr:hypothetical protein [Candidatus Aenigmarchaeota archaeon]